MGDFAVPHEHLRLQNASTPRYVGVIWVSFHVVQLLPIRLAQRNLSCISKPMMKHQQKSERKLGPSPDLVMLIGSTRV